MNDMTKAEILDIWKGFVWNMTDQGAVVPFAHEIASRARNSLLAQVEAVEKERDELRARIEEMERQEPSSPTTATGYGNRFPLYLAPGAQPTQSIPEGWGKDLLTLQHAMAMNNWNWNSDASDDLKREAYTAVTRLLAAAPEAKQ